MEDELISAFSRDREALFLAMYEPENVNQKKKYQETVDKLTEAKRILKSVIGIF